MTLTGWGGEALACPSCTTAKTGNGYLLATAVLLVLPLAALAGFTLWLRRRMMTMAPDTRPSQGANEDGTGHAGS